MTEIPEVAKIWEDPLGQKFTCIVELNKENSTCRPCAKIYKLIDNNNWKLWHDAYTYYMNSELLACLGKTLPETPKPKKAAIISYWDNNKSYPYCVVDNTLYKKSIRGKKWELVDCWSSFPEGSMEFLAKVYEGRGEDFPE